MKPDLAQLEDGNETVVGEKGVKLSGGQKQRISIARCLYSTSDIYVFDDCLSALDAHTGKNIFENVIEYLHQQSKTVVIVLNAIEYLKHCNKTIFIQDGKIEEVTEDFQKLKEEHEDFFKNLQLKNEKSEDKDE